MDSKSEVQVPSIKSPSSEVSKFPSSEFSKFPSSEVSIVACVVTKLVVVVTVVLNQVLRNLTKLMKSNKSDVKVVVK